MRVAVYTIALNEQQFVERWWQSAREADTLLIADTGSTDDTADIARRLGVTVLPVSVRPWRFDDARNAALAALPSDIDYCIALDMDEVLQPGWREALNTAHGNGWTRPRYRYVWSWRPDGSPGLVYGGDKIHARHGYRWRHPVHEVLTPTITETQGWTGLEIHHHPDHGKSRGQYLDLLALAVTEDPHDDRNAHYYGRELLYRGDLDGAVREFRRHLALPSAVWAPERAASMRYLARCLPDERFAWLHRAIAEAPDRREPWVDLALYHYERGEWAACHAAAVTALTITEPPLEYLCEEAAWGPLPHDLAAVSAWHLGMDAVPHGEASCALAPDDDRLAGNLALYRSR